MKRGTPNHPKVYDLAERLGVSWATAIGHLELLFHFTAQYCPQGNLGRYSDKRIASALGWHKSPQVLLESLSGSGWVDVHPEWRWTVHDWHLHCDRTTVQRLSRSGLKPLEPIHKVTEKVCTQAQRETLSPPVPEPEPVPLPEPVPPPDAFCPAPPPSPDLSGIASEIWQRHPGHRRGTRQSAEHDLAIRCAGAVDPLAVATSINRTHAECCLSEQWRAGRAMGLTRWLTEDGPGTCMSAPPPRMETARQKSFSEQRQDQTRQKFISGLDWEKPRG